MSTGGASTELTQAVKSLAKQHGASLVGIAPIERFDPQPPYFDRAPKGHDPRDFVPEARSVISVAMPILSPVLDAPALLLEQEIELVPPDVKHEYLERLYNVMGHRLHDYMLEFIGQIVGQHLLVEGFDAMIFPTPGIHPRVSQGGGSERNLPEQTVWNGPGGKWAELYSPFGHSPGPFSHRHAATRAGLGEFGYNNLVLTPQFGSRQRFNSIITEAELVPDPLIDEPICLRDACRLCQKACYMNVVTMRDDPRVRDYRSVDVVDKEIMFVDTPVKTDTHLCNLRKHRLLNPPVRGDCARVCPIGESKKRPTQRLEALACS